MLRLKILFSILLLVTALPVWRFMDMITWFDLSKQYLVILFFIWSTLFLIIPISLLAHKKLFIPIVIINLGFSVLVYVFSSPYSSSPLDSPESRHCSLINFTGFFYHLKSLAPAAHEDDLLIRNQICWARKLSDSIPENLNKLEAETYLKLVEEKLFLPTLKWKTTIPFFIPIYLKMKEHLVDTILIQKFWNTHYTAEVRERDYNFFSFPHGDYIKWEYKLIEFYWSNFIESIEIEEAH